MAGLVFVGMILLVLSAVAITQLVRYDDMLYGDPLAKPSPPRRWGVTTSRDSDVWWVTAERCSVYIASVELGVRAATALLSDHPEYAAYFTHH